MLMFLEMLFRQHIIRETFAMVQQQVFNVPACWSTVKAITRWDSDDLDRILQNGDCLFKSLSLFRLLGVEDLPAEINIYGQVARIELLENKIGELTLNTYLISLTEIVSCNYNTGNGALLFVDGYVLGIIWEKQCFYLFDSHSKDRHGNICQNGTAVLLKFASLNNLERYIKLIYYNEM